MRPLSSFKRIGDLLPVLFITIKYRKKNMKIKQSPMWEKAEIMLAVTAFLIWAGNPGFSNNKIIHYSQALIEHEMEGFNDEEIH